MNKIFKRSGVEPKDKKAEQNAGPKRLSTFGSFTIKDQISFAKSLAILIRSGIPIVQCLHMIRRQAKSKRTQKMYSSVIEDVENGSYLSTSLAKFRKSFGELAINIIEIGEISGTLHENLNYLSEELKKKQILRRKIMSALVYPIFIVFATVGISIMLTAFAFPKILPIFTSLKFKLPISTRILIFVSKFLISYGGLLLLGLILFVIAFVLLMRVRGFRLFIDRVILSLPIFGKVVQGYNMANFARTLSVLLKSEVSIVHALKITAKTVNNIAYQDNILLMSEHVSRGSKISSHLEAYPNLYPPMLAQMVVVGESTGNLSDTLSYLATVSEEEIDEVTKNLSSVLEPILMVFMGLVVGFIAISIITPIYGITQNLHG